MSEWKDYKIENLAEVGSSKRIFYSEYVLSGVPFYRSKEIIEKKEGKEIADCLYIDKKKFDEIKEKYGAPIKGDLLLSSVGHRSGIPYVVKDEEEFYFKDGNLIWLRNFNNLDSIFLYHWINSSIGQNSLESIMIGSAQKALTISGIKSLNLTIPPLPEQKAIAAVLSSLDDKIDLLHRQNKTLEAMAETLFRQWFVEEAGEDWEEKPLSQVANFLNGLACQKYPPENDIDKLPVLKIRELSSGISESSDWASSDIKPEYIIENGDVIFAWSASLMVKIWHGKRCILNQHLFKVTSEEYLKWFYFMWCKHHLDEFISISSSHATTMGHIKRGDLDNAMVLIPTDDELKIMSSKMTPILNKQIANHKQIQTLETLRDNLLPKLISGEVRVKYNEDDELETIRDHITAQNINETDIADAINWARETH